MNREVSKGKPQTVDSSRRCFVRTAAYAAPVILTLQAMPAMANTGSNRSDSQVPGLSNPGTSTPSTGGSPPVPQAWRPSRPMRDRDSWGRFWRNFLRSFFSWR